MVSETRFAVFLFVDSDNGSGAGGRNGSIQWKLCQGQEGMKVVYLSHNRPFCMIICALAVNVGRKLVSPISVTVCMLQASYLISGLT